MRALRQRIADLIRWTTRQEGQVTSGWSSRLPVEAAPKSLLHPLHLHTLRNFQLEGFISKWLVHRKLVYHQVNSILINWAIDIDCRRKSDATEIMIGTINNLRFEFAFRAVNILPDR
jgi:hypothetical protein